MTDLPALAHRFRLLGVAVAWAVLSSGMPGLLTADGVPLLAVIGVGLWAHVEARPYKGRAWKGFAAHAIGATPGCAVTMLWIRHVYPPPLLYVGVGLACYSAFGGVLLRRLLALPAPTACIPLLIGLAYTAVDTARAYVPLPFGVEWMRLGYHAHAWLPVAESVRGWGVTGLSFTLATLGGSVAVALRARALRPAWIPVACGTAPLLLALALGAMTDTPAMRPGPRVLIVQPGFSQERKQFDKPSVNFAELRERTRAALATIDAAGEPPPDLVAWGESMLYVGLFEEEVRGLANPEAPSLRTGAMVPNAQDLRELEITQRALIHGELFGRGDYVRPGSDPVLPPGTSFLAGAEVFVAHAGEIRRTNSAVLYDAEGRRSRAARKRWLVPGAETMYGLERVGPVRSFIHAVSGYIPSFLAADELMPFTLRTRDGAAYTLSTSICFDNAHLAAFTDPAAAGPLDAHVVLSNEAWYKQSFEADQMVAFTRIGALASGRAVARVTNSGISLLMGADGREVARIRAGDEDRMVAGELLVRIPVPAEGQRDAAPPIARLRRPLDMLWMGLAAVLALLGGRAGRSRAASSSPAGNPAGAAG